MKNYLLISFVTALLLMNLSTLQIYGNNNSIRTDQEPTIQLFNGQNLDGWYTFLKVRGRNIDPSEVFTVKNGMIRISGQEWGCITTEKEYENYHLIVEYKWGKKTFEPRVDKARDSGILLHSVGEDGGYSGTWMHSIECQLIEGGTGDFIVVGDGSDRFSLTSPVAQEKQGNSYVFQQAGNPETIHNGRINWFGRDANWQDVKGFRGEKDVEKPIGEWNKLECIANQGTITIYLNGILINKAFNVQPSKGRIQIQSESSEIFFKKIELTHLF